MIQTEKSKMRKEQKWILKLNTVLNLVVNRSRTNAQGRKYHVVFMRYDNSTYVQVTFIIMVRIYSMTHNSYIYIGRVLHSSTVSVGLVQARPNYNYYIVDKMQFPY